MRVEYISQGVKGRWHLKENYEKKNKYQKQIRRPKDSVVGKEDGAPWRLSAEAAPGAPLALFGSHALYLLCPHWETFTSQEEGHEVDSANPPHTWSARSPADEQSPTFSQGS